MPKLELNQLIQDSWGAMAHAGMFLLHAVELLLQLGQRIIAEPM